MEDTFLPAYRALHETAECSFQALEVCVNVVVAYKDLENLGKRLVMDLACLASIELQITGGELRFLF